MMSGLIFKNKHCIIRGILAVTCGWMSFYFSILTDLLLLSKTLKHEKINN